MLSDLKTPWCVTTDLEEKAYQAPQTCRASQKGGSKRGDSATPGASTDGTPQNRNECKLFFTAAELTFS